MHEPLNDERCRFLGVKTPTHQVVHLVRVKRCAGRTVSCGHLVGQHFELRNGLCSGFFREEEVLEHLTGIAVVGLFGDGQETGGDGMAAVVACRVDRQGRVGATNVVVNLEVVVDVPLATTVHGYRLSQPGAGSSESSAQVVFAAEPTHRQRGMLNVSVTANGPVLTAQQFAVHRKLVDQSVRKTHVGAHLSGDVKTGPVGLAGKMDHHRGIAFCFDVEVPHRHMARCHGTNMHRWCVG